MDFLADLNPAQLQAVQTTEGAVRVVAGPGTGKTRTLTRRFCYLVAELGLAPQNILCVTFTNRAANEMKRRVRDILGDLDLGLIATFHAFCVQLLKEDIHVLNFPKNFLILDTEDQKQMLQKIFGDMGLTLRDTTIKRTLDEVLEAKKLSASTYIDDIYLLNNERLKARFHQAADRDEEIFFRYLYEQKKCFGCDFNDLINFAAYILENFEEVRLKWQERMQYVMIDEFQDVSARQYKLGRLLAGRHGNLFIVGDPDQTIYSWRGSHVRLFLDFDRTYPGAQTVTLTENYRSRPEITRAAEALIEKNRTRFPKELRAVRASGPRPRYYHAKSDREEADWIFSQIRRLQEEAVPLGDIAVLYRAHFLTRVLEERFIEGGLPYRIFSGLEFYGRREIKDIICYLRLVTAGDDAAFLRIVNRPPRRIGRKRLQALAEYAEARSLSLYEALKENLAGPRFQATGAAGFVEAVEKTRNLRRGLTLDDALQLLMDLSGYEEYLRLQGDQERLDNAAELKRSLIAFGQEDEEAVLEDFLARAALFTNLDHEDQRETVKFLTVHAAKGLEFSHVFVRGLNEGVFPSRKIQSPEEMEEERRLAYVAMTRARDGLYLSGSEGLANDGLYKYPSRFLFDISRENLDFLTDLDETLIESRRPSVPAGPAPGGTAAFSASARVEHPVLGPGTVLRVKPEEGLYIIQFDRLATERSLRFDAGLKPDQPVSK